MRSIRFPSCIVAVVAAASLAFGVLPSQARPVVAPSAYTIDAAASTFTFVTTKNVNVSEVQQFKRFNGTIAASGAVTMTIDLSSVETGIPIRNERVQSMLFEVLQFPTAQFDATIDPGLVRALKVGDSMDVDVAGKLTLHGQTQDMPAALRVVRLTGNRVLVTTRAPILVTAARYGLEGGIEKLREIVGLPNISGTVPVTFSLVFAQ